MASSLWLDKVRAIPIVGLHMEPVYRSSSAILDSLESLIVLWAQRGWAPSIKTDTVGQLTLETNLGFSFIVTHDQLLGRFGYLANINEVGNDVPTVKFAYGPEPMSKLRELLAVSLVEVFLNANGAKIRQLKRIGVVAQSVLDATRLPPGVQAFLEYLGRPWGGLTGGLGNFTTNVFSSPEAVDKCHHGFAINADAQQINLALDWQRYYTASQGLTKTRLNQVLHEAFAAADEYFGKFGIGDLPYESNGS